MQPLFLFLKYKKDIRFLKGEKFIFISERGKQVCLINYSIRKTKGQLFLTE